MVTGGREKRDGKGQTSVDLFSMDGTKLCSLPDLLAGRDHHSQDGLIICGGGHKKAQADVAATCDTFSDGKWKKTHTLGRKRKNAPSWASPQGVLIMVGKTTELLTDDGDTKASFTLDNTRV